MMESLEYLAGDVSAVETPAVIHGEPVDEDELFDVYSRTVVGVSGSVSPSVVKIEIEAGRRGPHMPQPSEIGSGVSDDLQRLLTDERVGKRQKITVFRRTARLEFEIAALEREKVH